MLFGRVAVIATSKNIDKILGETDAIDSSLRLMDILMDLHFFFFSERKMSLALFRGTQERSLCVKHF